MVSKSDCFVGQFHAEYVLMVTMTTFAELIHAKFL